MSRLHSKFSQPPVPTSSAPHIASVRRQDESSTGRRNNSTALPTVPSGSDAPRSSQARLSEDALQDLSAQSAALLSLIQLSESRDGTRFDFRSTDVQEAERKLRQERTTYDNELRQNAALARVGLSRRSTTVSETHDNKKRKSNWDEERLDTSSGDSYDPGEDGSRPFLNSLGQITWHYEEKDLFLNPGDSDAKPLLVQAAASCVDTGVPWQRTALKGNVPLALRMAEWSLDKRLGKVQAALRQILVSIPLQILIALPGATAPWEMMPAEPNYYSHSGFYWKWPKHAINPLDSREDRRATRVKPNELSTRQRLLRPRQLMVEQEDGSFKLMKDPGNVQYIFLSYNWGSFNPDGGPDEDYKVKAMGEYLCRKEDIHAYYQDKECNAPESQPDLLTADVNRMSDVIRGSRFVAILLPDGTERSRKLWGQRMWTLPEGLLAPGRLRVCTWISRDKYKVQMMRKVEMSQTFWTEDRGDAEEASARSLAEHYDGGITLSRLELFSTAISALSSRKTASWHTKADMAYALMGILRYRIEPDDTDDLFQVIARLSLTNDHDHLIERLVSLYPHSIDMRTNGEFWRSFAGKDQYETHLWDVTPRCQVVGVGDEPNTVLLSDCRAVPIEWAEFPRMMYKMQAPNRKKTLSEIAVRSGAWWIMASITLAFTYAPIFLSYREIRQEFKTLEDEDRFPDNHRIPDFSRWFWETIVIFVGVGGLLAFFAPRAARDLFGGAIMQPAPHLVAFEGTVPRSDLEKLIFGRDVGRLKYEPSSTPWGRDTRHPFIRKGLEPGWIARGGTRHTLPGHRWFTLVDTGNLGITVFQARRPPTVALITGAEGGMLRAVLCSWRFTDDCHYRETVIRVQGNTWDRSKPTAWIKVSLRSQDDGIETSEKVRPGAATSTAASGPKHSTITFKG